MTDIEIAQAHEMKKIVEVAAKAGINAAALKATVARYNGFVKAKKDADFDRPVQYMKAEISAEGPYYIVEQKVRYQTTLGGLRAGEGLRILDKSGKPIPGLFGAGCVVGGANGADSMTAMMNSWAIVSGVIAAETAVGK